MKKIRLLLFTALGLASALGANAGIIPVEPGGDIRAALRNASAADTVLLKAGEYTLASQIEQARDIVLMGEKGAMPVVYFTNFVLGVDAKKLVIEGLHIIYTRKYLVYNANEKEVDIDRIVLRGCIVNLNGADGASVILNRSTAARNRIGSVEIDDCVIYNAQAPSHGVVNVGRESTAKIASIRLRNSTFADFARGVVIVGAPMDDLTIAAENCTFFKINTTENSAAVFHADAGNVRIDISRCIFHLPGASPKFADAGTGGQVVVADSYRVNLQPRVRNPYGLQNLKGDAGAVFASPADDPLDGCTSYRIIDPAIAGKSVGDPRWK